MSELQDIPIADLMPHPDNPRLRIRDDVVTQIAAEITRSGFGREHALLVRPVDGGHQIISGHHRYEAAKRVGLDTVPCWVREMDDAESFMLLVLSNTQGELSPLEIGTHALKAVPPAERKAGQGFKSYAERIGVTGAYVGQLHAAAEVFSLLNSSLAAEVYDKAKHLYEISKAPRETWSMLADLLVRQEWSVADAAHRVVELRAFDIPEHHRFWMAPDQVALAHLKSPRFDAGKVKKIIAAADGVYEWIEKNADPYDADEFTNWLKRQQQDAWDAKKIDGWLVELIGRVRERQLTPEIREGDFRKALADLPDGSVDLILTDPPYGDDAVSSYGYLAEFAARKLRPGGSLICYSGQASLPAVFDAIRPHDLRYWWMLSLDHNHGGQQLPGKWVMCEWKPLLWFVRGGREDQTYVADKVRGSKPDKDAHEWAQGIDEVFYLIEQLTRPDQLVVDPFAGSGAFGKAALSLGRRFIGATISGSVIVE